MINHTIKKTVVVGASSFSYTLTSSNSNIVINNPSGTVDSSSKTLEFEILVPTEDDFSNSNFILTIVTDCNTKTVIFQESSPCELESEISHNPTTEEYYTYDSLVNTNNEYEVVWAYDTTIFQSIIENQDQLVLRLKIGQTHPATHDVSMDVTTEFGCKESYVITTSLCRPSVQNLGIVLSCVEGRGITLSNSSIRHFNSGIIKVIACTGTEIDWSTLTLNGTLPSGVFISNSNNRLYVYVADTVTSPPTSLSFTVKDNRGVVSNTFSVSLIYDICESSLPSPMIEDEHVVFNPGVTTGDIQRIPVDRVIFSPKEIDWSTFTFVAATGQTLVSATELTATNGTAIFDASREIVYEYDSKNENVDLVQFKIADVDGNYSNVAKFTIDAEVLDQPEIIPKTYAVLLNAITNFDSYLTGSTGVLDLQSLTVVTPPQYGTATPKSDGSIDYFTSSAEDDEFEITIMDTNGNVSDPITITIEPTSSGTVIQNPTVCGGDTLDFYEYLTNYTTGGVWTEDGDNPDTVSLVDPTSVTMPAATSYGLYKFYYDNGTVTELQVTVRREFIGITGITGVGTSRTITVVTYGYNNINDLFAEVDYNSGAVITNFNFTSFDGTNGEVTVLLDDGAGDYDVTVQGENICGNVVTAVTSFTI